MTKYAIAYFSQTNTTKREADQLGKALGVDPVAITPKKPYSASDVNWTDDNSRVNREHNDPSIRPEINPVDLGDYDVLFLGYPTWWGVAPNLINTFIESQNFDGKTIVPFTTSSSSGAEEGGQALKQALPGIDVRDAKRTNGMSADQLAQWVKQLGL